MADYPGLTMWTDAYLADTTHLTDAEHGRYLLILFHMWRMPEKRFPNNDEWLARKFGRTVEQVQTDFRPLIAEFFLNDGNWLCHKRLIREWHKIRKTHERQSANAKSRWTKEKALSHGNATLAMPPQPQRKNGRDSDSPSLLPSVPSESPSNVVIYASPTGAADAKPKPRGSRMPEDWDPGDAGRAWARSELSGPKLNDAFIEAETDRCKDWAWSTAGQKAVKCNWNRFWKNWMRTAHGRLREQEARERWREQRGRPAH